MGDAQETLESRPHIDENKIFQEKLQIYRDAEETVNECHKEIKKSNEEAKYYQRQFQKFLEMQDDTLVFIWNSLSDARREMKEDENIHTPSQNTKIRPIGDLTLDERENLLDRLFRKLNGLDTGHDFVKYALGSEKIIVQKNR